MSLIDHPVNKPKESSDPFYNPKSPSALKDHFRNGEFPYQDKINKREYERLKLLLQIELLKVQSWAKETDQKFIMIFEGRDAAGKGGTIKRFMEHLNPRGARVVGLDKPSEVEAGQCQPTVKWFCLTAHGTTEVALRRSWVFAHKRNTSTFSVKPRNLKKCSSIPAITYSNTGSRLPAMSNKIVLIQDETIP